MTFPADHFFLYFIEALINASLAATLLTSLAWVVLCFIRPLSAAFRSFVWAATLGGVLVVPLSVAILPPVWSLESIAVNNATAPTSAPDYRTPVVQEIPATRSHDQSQSHSNTAGPAGGSDFPDRPVEPLLPIVIRMAVFIWFAGAVVVLGRFLAGSVLIRARAHRTSRAVAAEWGQAIREAARQLDLASGINVLQDDRTVSPAVWGFFKPTVFLPQSPDWTDDRKRAVLLHEFAHIKRRDLQMLWVTQCAAAVYWFHPVVLHAANEYRMACEQACDDAVVSAGVSPSDYASYLLDISQLLPKRCPRWGVAHLLGAHPLERRVASILDPEANRRLVSASAKAVAAIAVLALLALVGAIRPFGLEASEQSRATDASSKSINKPGQSVNLPANSSLISDEEDASVAVSNGNFVKAKGDSTEGRSVQEARVDDSAQSLVEIQKPSPVLAGVSQLQTAAPAPNDRLQITDSAVQVPVPTAADFGLSHVEARPASLSHTGSAKAGVVPVRGARDVTLAKGTQVWFIFTDSLDSKTASAGADVNLILARDVTVDGSIVAKAGSKVVGRVVLVKKARIAGRSGILDLRLELPVEGKQIVLCDSMEKHDSVIHYSRSFHLKWPFGLFRTGDDVEIPAGTGLRAYVSEDTVLALKT
ncbi:MAG: M56 family metallopeptidase [Opitutaceae bacterium]|jgi:beta-lactamase regulating signal transducer with metallopeptidase domain